MTRKMSGLRSHFHISDKTKRELAVIEALAFIFIGFVGAVFYFQQFAWGMHNLDGGQNMRVLNAGFKLGLYDEGVDMLTGEMVTFTPEAAYRSGFRMACVALFMAGLSIVSFMTGLAMITHKALEVKHGN